MDNVKHTKFIDLKKVAINDAFWTPFMERIRTQVIPYQWEALNDRVPGADPSYCVRNFKLAAELTHPELDYGVPKDIGHGGCVFQDSDFAKWIEAAAYSLVWHPDPDLEKTLDNTIDTICNAQQSDGYLDTYYIINGIDKRFTNLKDNHELYCFGHLLEGAIAYYEATGKQKLMDALIRYADCIDKHIGVEEGKLHGYPGHEIAEMALVRLYAITKNEKHLKLAKYFIDQRGQKPLYFEEETKQNKNHFYWHDSYIQYQYYQAGKPVREQHIAEGHAVRAVYLYSGMADIARLTGDEELLAACEALFANISKRQMYITGAIGQSAYGEAFSYDYSLPNDTAYAETCAAIGLAFFARRMSAIAPRGLYADVLEKTLYNGIISGMSLDGKAFFYVNPLEALPEACLKDRRMSHVRIERQKWFGCACCPPNLARIIASLGSYIHSKNAETLYTHLYIGSKAKVSTGGTDLTISIETKYPWEGLVNISFSLNGAAHFRYGLRIPGWCRNYTLKLNGADADTAFTVEDGYAVFNREWKDGDRISAAFDMPVTFVRANPKVRENVGKTAVMRGPVVYCLEEADNGKELWRLHVGQNAGITVKHEKALLGGVTLISMTGKREKDWVEDDLYRTLEDSTMEDKALHFIPYYAWTNRSPGEMTVWVNR
ncbi:MAG: glycoside hydrolase family 127 protein [Treponema sp.]|jgi:DUF1680 family protein|nr:glycoside hydrolase family 127 protein [Treponema sp.]